MWLKSVSYLMKNDIFTKKIKHPHLWKHETKKKVLYKFVFVLFIFFGYFIFVAYEYGVEQGFLVASLTWSFFVLCTPIADAGFLIDFPLRLVTTIRMFVSEIFVWSIAIIINIYAFFVVPDIYDTTAVLSLFKHILEKPVPFWLIIVLSGVGTFASIQFGDELLDKISHHEREKYHKHKNNYKLIFLIFIFFITFVLYDYLLHELGIAFD